MKQYLSRKDKTRQERTSQERSIGEIPSQNLQIVEDSCYPLSIIVPCERKITIEFMDYMMS